MTRSPCLNTMARVLEHSHYSDIQLPSTVSCSCWLLGRPSDCGTGFAAGLEREFVRSNCRLLALTSPSCRLSCICQQGRSTCVNGIIEARACAAPFCMVTCSISFFKSDISFLSAVLYLPCLSMLARAVLIYSILPPAQRLWA